jgi:hypothetical protein
VVKATEEERRRRIEENQDEEANERLKRQEWARQAIAAEQRRVLREKAILSMEDTPWFQKMTSSYPNDYIIVCPNTHLGCDHSCPRSHIVQHLKVCDFSGERRTQHCVGETQPEEDDDGMLAPEDGARDWVVVCPYSVFGCGHNCKYSKLDDHLLECRFRGISRREEEELRRKSCSAAVRAAEKERQRRIIERNKTVTPGSGSDRVSMLMQLIRGQTLSFQSVLGQEISNYGAHCNFVFREREAQYLQAIALVRGVVQGIWPKADLQPYGSYASGLMTPDSDIDLVVCMAGDFSWRSSSQEWMSELASNLSRCSWVTDLKAIDGAVMPVIKLSVTCDGLCVPIDVTFNGALHYGIASAAFVKQLVKELPSVGPVTQVLKRFLGQHGLNDPYTGGMPAYGIVLIVTAIALQLREQHRREQLRDPAHVIGSSGIGVMQRTSTDLDQTRAVTSVRGGAGKRDAAENSSQDASIGAGSAAMQVAAEAGTGAANVNKPLEVHGGTPGAFSAVPPDLYMTSTHLPPTRSPQMAPKAHEVTSSLMPTFSERGLSARVTALGADTSDPPSALLPSHSSTAYADTAAMSTMTIPKGVYVSRTNSDSHMDMNVKSNPPSPVRRRSRVCSGGGQPFWDPVSQLRFGAQCGVEIAYPFIQHQAAAVEGVSSPPVTSVAPSPPLTSHRFRKTKSPASMLAVPGLPPRVSRRALDGELQNTLRKIEHRGSPLPQCAKQSTTVRDGDDSLEAQVRRMSMSPPRMAGSRNTTDVLNADPLVTQDVEDVLTAASTMDQAVGCLLMDVMHFVSSAFNFEVHTLSVMNGGCAYPRQGGSADPVVIEDPLRRVNNVGRSCFRFGELQKVLGDALIALSAGVVRSESHMHELGASIRMVLGLGLSSDTRRGAADEGAALAEQRQAEC